MRDRAGRFVLLALVPIVAVIGLVTLAGGKSAPVSPDLPATPVAGECTVNSDCPLPDQFCSKAAGNCNGSGSCQIRPDVCIEVYDPVCGCDGVTYSNACFAASNGVNVASEGACGGPQCGARNDPCSANSDCCSGVCKRNGRCR